MAAHKGIRSKAYENFTYTVFVYLMNTHTMLTSCNIQQFPKKKSVKILQQKSWNAIYMCVTTTVLNNVTKFLLL